MVKTNRVRKGFSLVELVVVILIMGVLAAVAAPKMFDKADDAKRSGTRQSLAVLRDAIELFKSQHPEGKYPSNLLDTDPTIGIAGMIKGSFPKNSLLLTANDTAMVKNVSPINGVETTNEDWLYDSANGEIRINRDGYLAD